MAAESHNRVTVTLEELMVSTLAMTDALSKFLIEKAVTSVTEFKKKLGEERAAYHAICSRWRTDMPKTRLKFIEPAYARLVNKLPEGEDWLYEVKFDGYRCLAGKDASGVTLWSRRGNLE